MGIDTRGMRVEHLGGGAQAFVKDNTDGTVEVISDGNLGIDVDNPMLEPVRLVFASRQEWEDSGSDPITVEYLGSPHRASLNVTRCVEGDHPNDDNPGKRQCRTCEDWN